MSNAELSVRNNGAQDLIQFDDDKIKLIKDTIAKNATQNELDLFLYMASKRGLDPLAKQIYFIKYGQGAASYVCSIDAYRLIAERTGRYAPGRAATYEYSEDGALIAATAYVLKLAGSTWHEVSETAYWDEYAQYTNNRPRDLWAKMPRVMLSKCAEARVLRRAFPEDLSGLYTDDEIRQAPAPAPLHVVETEVVGDDSEYSPPAGGIDENGYVWCACGERARYVRGKTASGWRCHSKEPVCQYALKDTGQEGLVRPPAEVAPQPEAHPLDDAADPVVGDYGTERTPLGEAVSDKIAAAQANGNPEEEAVFVKDATVHETEIASPRNGMKRFWAVANKKHLDNSDAARGNRMAAVNALLVGWDMPGAPFGSLNEITDDVLARLAASLEIGELTWQAAAKEVEAAA